MADRPLPSSFDENAEYQETGFQKVSRKLREEPLVPLGTALTCLALYNAFRAMRRGDHAGVQRMFRARIGAQAFTVLAMVAGGAYYGADREKRKELIKLEAQKRAEERNEKWLHELEVRDDEDKKLQAAMKRKRDRLEQKRVEEAEREAERGGEQAGPKVATASADTTATAAATADAPSKETSGGSGVLGALSDAGGWFGTKKGPAEQSKADAEVPKK
ncbi:mitochondrial hypoxia responsive domain-containing protein [Xylaria longipes]|nr:mitochondrial hypoxia responsive domain-containing protein [Xylaria longipes]